MLLERATEIAFYLVFVLVLASKSANGWQSRQIASISFVTCSKSALSMPSTCHVSNPFRISRRTELEMMADSNQKKRSENDIHNAKNNHLIQENTWSKLAIAIICTAGAAVTVLGRNVDFNSILSDTLTHIAELGPLGYLYFAAVYIAAELLAIPAMPLTASSGYLFGLLPGTILVITSATIAASISFFIGRTFLRDWAQNFIQNSPRWRAIDRAIGKEGFKVVLLLRLSPLLPFALSNYLYAVTSVDFWSFISATFLGFAPGTFGLVYFGSAGKAIFEGVEGLPWYGYVLAGGAVAILAQSIAKIATNAIQDIGDESVP